MKAFLNHLCDLYTHRVDGAKIQHFVLLWSFVLNTEKYICLSNPYLWELAHGNQGPEFTTSGYVKEFVSSPP